MLRHAMIEAKIERLSRLALGTALAISLSGGAAAAAEDGVTLLFDTGSTRISPAEAAKLDLAVRAFREGNWIRFVVSGKADTLGPADVNLALSVERAIAVVEGLKARGIRAEQLQVVGVGEAELAVPTPDQTPEPQNRIVQITMR